MPIVGFPKCWRGRTDCEPFQAIDAAPAGVTDEQIMACDYEPVSFVCCGCVAEEERPLPQDAYRVCFKNSAVDEMSDNDEQDLAHLMAVVAQWPCDDQFSPRQRRHDRSSDQVGRGYDGGPDEAG